MARVVQLWVDYDDDWSRCGDFCAGGVILGLLTLRLRNTVVLDHVAAGINNSVVTMLQSTLEDHTAAPEASLSVRQPMIFCAGNIDNRCGVLYDFSVIHHGAYVTFTDFLECQCAQRDRITVPWKSWAVAVDSLAQQVVRRCPPKKKGLCPESTPQYQKLRGRIKALHKRLRDKLNGRV